MGIFSISVKEYFSLWQSGMHKRRRLAKRRNSAAESHCAVYYDKWRRWKSRSNSYCAIYQIAYINMINGADWKCSPARHVPSCCVAQVGQAFSTLPLCRTTKKYFQNHHWKLTWRQFAEIKKMFTLLTFLLINYLPYSGLVFSSLSLFRFFSVQLS